MTRLGMEFRIGQMRHVFNYLPPVFLQSLDPLTGNPTSPWLPLCGKCFKPLKDDPFEGRPGQIRPMSIANNRRCFRCGRKCHPVD